ncbi:MAG: NAD(+) synthase [Treponema sp.]|nr:NAD(+) synthase [Treponema sp.]
MNYGFFRVAAVSPDVTVADCKQNATNIIKYCHEASSKGASLIVFPELSITSYSCGDLFQQTLLQEEAIKELERIAEETKEDSAVIEVGLPIAYANALYNCAAIIFRGNIEAIIPKTFIPNYSEFYEKRYFSPAFPGITSLNLSEKFPEVPFGTKILISDSGNKNFVLGTEICEDGWVPIPPSTYHTLAGATVIANLSASNEVIGKASYRRTLFSSQSARSCCVYIYSDAGHGESSTDLIFSSHNIISENGKIIAETKLFDEQIIYADVDLERITQERRKMTTYTQCSYTYGDNPNDYQIISLPITSSKKTAGFNASSNQKAVSLYRNIEKHPFIPTDKNARDVRCKEVIELQSEGLAKRLRHIHAKSAVIGLSGGLDSTLALLVTCRAFDKCSLDRKGILAITMPCFGTTDRTYNNACQLAKETGATLKEIPIKEAVNQHFKDIGHNPANHDVTYENCQARERTQVLMDCANMNNGIVIGTGDLSELALGWCTYNADQMSMYGVNSSIPKTLVRYLVNYFADEAFALGNKEEARVLKDILDTPVSPELLPPEENGNIAQKTEDLVGPYELHDFFMYYMLRFGFSPKKIFFLAKTAFDKQYSDEIILKWLKNFYKRFFNQQFKRSCMPDGAKVGTISLSPRGDWRMPSDASYKIWLEELENGKLTC